ncbi:MAG: PSD1 domain-containing protein [Akkermansiaceae bacterium]|nr:PSD1 domain-containing protein [Akkermansiaceae bacterium]
MIHLRATGSCLVILAHLSMPASAGDRISFNKHIRPIFIAKCTKCHGGAKADGDLSLIYRAEVLGKGKSGKTIIVPGKPDQSELFRRITTEDIDEKMPLQEGEHADEPLDVQQIGLVRKWIEQGAEWEEHWAYIKPQQQALPRLKNPSWVNTPMDHFVLARLEKNNLGPTAPADRAQWLRRASLDLTGMPPGKAELDAFLADRSPDAYEKEVTRLLASPHFGERWASVWMDLARYSDTMGYEKDPHRNIWPYRDYLIQSFNQDKPYDLFIREQLAGDLFAKPTSETLTATAFHRNTQTNTEGGTDDEEFRVAAVIDRVNTTWTATQGLTFGCIQCHAHPYEPIPHSDYYRFYAFFNSTEDADLDNDTPHFKVASQPAQRQLAAGLHQKLPALRRAINEPGRQLLLASKSWQPLNYAATKTSHGKLTAYPGGELRATGTFPVNTRYDLTATSPDFTAIRVTITPEAENPAELPERGSVLSTLSLHRVKADGSKEKIQLAYVFADQISGPYDPVASLENGRDGFGAYPKLFGKRQAVFVTAAPVTFGRDEKLEITMHSRASTTGDQACTVRRFTLDTSADKAWTELLQNPAHTQNVQAYNQARHQYHQIQGTNIPVIRERSIHAKRETRLFIGGLWLNKGEVQQAGVPKLLNGYQNKVDTRLEMAQWLTSPENPLTARVMANRLFAEMFGRGIVETLGDFGSTGTAPNNLPLLDHLAVAFQTTHQWSVKSLLREMVLSASYRQDHKTTPEMAEADPGNRLLARGPRNRLNAEMLRDHALKVSGLLTPKISGPSVMPPQPAGVWQTIYSGAQWKDATGPDRYRRALYTYWKRTSPYPSMITFDTPSRDLCNAQRIPTNTPLHALTTLNDPVYLECSRAFGKRMAAESAGDVRQQIAYGYLLATQQKPGESTVRLLTDLYQKLLTDYQANPENCKAVAGTPREAAMTVLANTIFNLDAALTK